MTEVLGMEHRMKLHFEEASLSDIKDLNKSFAEGRLKVMYTGGNQNGSEFSQDVIEAALPSLKNIPIVAHYDIEENEIGSHDMELVRDGERLRLRNLTEPCGVVPESAEAFFEESEDKSGTSHNYLVIEPVILWKRQEVYRHIRDDMDGRVDHSMEVNITAWHKEKGAKLVTVDAFEFEALCLLEKARPCYDGSELELFDTDGAEKHMRQMMQEMMQELRETFATVNPPDAEIDIKEDKERGGKSVLDEKLALVAEYGLDADELDFALDDFSPEELREKFEALKEAKADEEHAAKFELASNLGKVLADALQERKINKPWGETQAWWFEDFDNDAALVYAMCTQTYNIYAFPYTMDGDNAKIDFDAGKRMKRSYVEFDEGGEDGDQTAKMFQNMEQRYCENDERWAEKYEALSKEFETLKTETADVDELRTFKKDTEARQLEEARTEVFEAFAELGGVEEFEKLRENSAGFSDMDELREKCYAIKGRHTSLTAKFSADEHSQDRTPKQKVVRHDDETDEPYGGLFAKFGIEARKA